MLEDSVPTGDCKQSQTATPDAAIQSFQCSHCVLIFKSKLLLLEHLNNIHGFDVDAALSNAGLTSSKINKALAAEISGDSGSNQKVDDISCQHCDFKAQTLDDVVRHEEKCSMDGPPKEKGIPERIEDETSSCLTEMENQQNEEKGKNVPSLTSTSNSTKKHIRSQQTISRYLVSSLGSNVKPSQSDSKNGFIILRQPQGNSSIKRDGVLKVAASSDIDITKKGDRFLELDELFLSNLSSESDKTGKRTRSEVPAIPAKRAKIKEKDAEATCNKANQSSSNSQFSFDISEDESEKKDKQVNCSTIYVCKHCDYSSADLSNVSSHYQIVHPYIRYTSEYIQDPDDHSATFRCLECPIEFASTDKLKKHYAETHSDALDVFTTESHKLNLGFKCFLCSFNTKELKALEKHHKRAHPSLHVDNPLTYCKYSLDKCKDKPSICEETSSSKTSPMVSPQRATTPSDEVKKTVSKEAGASLYRCDTCNFRHHSVVVMYVHYQKCHPEETVTLAKIKQSVLSKKIKQPCVQLEMTPEKVSVTKVRSHSSPSKTVSHSSIKREKLELLQRKSNSSIKSEQRYEITQRLSETSKLDLKPVVTKGKGQRPHVKVAHKHIAEVYQLPTDMKVFYCKFCNFTSNKVKGVLGHHGAKHSQFSLISSSEVLQHSANVQAKQRRDKGEATQRSACSQPRLPKAPRCDEDKGADEAEAVSASPYGRVENLFFCQTCNFANLSVKGVLNHQSKVHSNLMSTIDCVVQYTTSIREKMKKSKCSRLPLPVLIDGDENKFFCYLCNFRHLVLADVLFHCSKRHPECVIKSERIRKYSSLVREQAEKLPLKSKEDIRMSLEDRGKETEGAQTRTHQCYRCPYTTQHIFLLRKHLKTVHNTNRPFSDVLQLYFRNGSLPAGFHCHMCVFSHEEAAELQRHYQDRHPERHVSLHFINTQLYAGVKQTSRKKKMPRSDHDTDKKVLSRNTRQDEGKSYPCRACSFKGNSLHAISSHYRAVHPWSVKEDGSVLDVITSCQVEDHTRLCESPSADLAPLEFEMSAAVSEQDSSLSSTLHKCLYCPSGFDNRRGLSKHYIKKHGITLSESSDDHPSKEIDKSGGYVQVYKCPLCAYVNTLHYGMVTHCLMKHPSTAAADNFKTDYVLMSNSGECATAGPTGELRYKGYLCELCAVVFSLSKKLQVHREIEHSQTAPTTVKAARKDLLDSKQLSEYETSTGTGMRIALFKKKINATLRCPYCKLICKSKISLNQHVSIHHKKQSQLKDLQGTVYCCTLCSYTTGRPRYLRSHFTQKHGKATSMKYHVQISPQTGKLGESSSSTKSETGQPEDSPEIRDPNRTPFKGNIYIYKCPSCSYVNTRHHGTLTHCQMIHPKITVRAETLETEEVQLSSVVGYIRNHSGKVKFGGYMCKLCPVIFLKLADAKLHSEQVHGQEMSKRPFKHSVRLKNQLLSKYRSTRTLALQANFYKGKKFAKFYCKYCKYSCSLKASLDQHTRIHHNSDPVAPDVENVYKCALCPYSSPKKKYVSTHHTLRHGKSIPFKFVVQQSGQSQESPETVKSAKDLNKHSSFKCSLCNYSTNLYKYLSKHYLRTHQLAAQHPLRLQYNKNSEEFHANRHSKGGIQCKLCPGLSFDSLQVLSEHYCDFHSSEIRFDFTMLTRAPKKGTGTYKCGYCDVTVKGVKSLVRHLSQHTDTSVMSRKRMKMRALSATEETTEAEHNKLAEQDAALEAGRSTEKEESPMSNGNEMPDPRPAEKVYSCKLCVRTFYSMVGLRVHERSHETTDALKRIEVLNPKSQKIFNKYIVIKAGTGKPFHCSVCPYRTNLMGLWRSHLVKKHPEVFTNPDAVDDEEVFDQVAENDLIPAEEECATSSEITERSVYLEPRDVQRQLNHYNLMTQANVSSEANPQYDKSPDDYILYCELCSFATEHLSSIRRHYMNRHGKKLLRCKDCTFVTGSRKVLETHMEGGHSNTRAEAAHQKVLNCPLCIYQTKTKNNMIDHIVLHREERVVPIEVCRPKLSRYLQGMVFRCHKCTFASASDENLRLHMMKHNEVKPYKCRLCYFDCSTLSDLEAHLCDKHQVVRNHELVGQINLDQQEEQLFAMSECESNGDTQQLEGEFDETSSLRNDLQCIDIDMSYPAGPEGSSGNDMKASSVMQDEGLTGALSQGGTVETNRTSGSVFLQKDVKANSVDQSNPSAETGKANIECEEDNPNREGVKDLTETNNCALPCTKNCELGERKPVTNRAPQGWVSKMDMDIDTQVGDEVPQYILQLEEEGSAPATSDEQSKEMSELMPARINNSHPVTETFRTLESLPVEREHLGATQNCEQVNHKQQGNDTNSSIDCSNGTATQAPCAQNCNEKPSVPHDLMPVLENQYLTEEGHPVTRHNNRGRCENFAQRQETPDQVIGTDDCNPCATQESEDRTKAEQVNTLPIDKGALAAPEVAADVSQEPVSNDKPFTCKLCGRRLMSRLQLEHHVKRHGV